VFTELAPVISDIAKEIPGLVSAFLPLIPVIGKIAEVFFEIVAAVLPMFVELVDALLPLFDELVPILAEAFLEIMDAAVPILLMLAEALVPIVVALLPPLVEIFTALAPIVITLIEAFLPLIEMILPILVELIELLMPIIVFLAELLADLLVGAIGILTEWIGFLVEKGQEFAVSFATAWFRMSTGIVQIINMLITGLERFVNAWVRGLNKLVEGANKIREALGQAPIQMVAEVTFGRVALPEMPQILKDLYSNPQAVNTGTLAGILAASGVPAMAKGGVVDGATLALIGEAGPEAVIPLDKFDSMGGNHYYITVNSGVGDPVRIGEDVVKVIKRYERSSGKVFASA
jgi:phage-related protein